MPFNITKSYVRIKQITISVFAHKTYVKLCSNNKFPSVLISRKSWHLNSEDCAPCVFLLSILLPIHFDLVANKIFARMILNLFAILFTFCSLINQWVISLVSISFLLMIEEIRWMLQKSALNFWLLTYFHDRQIQIGSKLQRTRGRKVVIDCRMKCMCVTSIRRFNVSNDLFFYLVLNSKWLLRQNE